MMWWPLRRKKKVEVRKPEIGETWRQTTTFEDPFNEPSITDVEIIDKKDGWVKYGVGSDRDFTITKKISIFLVCFDFVDKTL